MATQADLDALRAAINEGISRVQYADRSVDYRSLNEMIRIEQRMAREIEVQPVKGRLTPTFCKGL